MKRETPEHPESVYGLMPVLNAMPYLRMTLASITAQDYPNFRLIAWDNGSTDGSADELRRWIPEKIDGEVITDRPLPLGQCRAALIDRADRELCAWFDADDLYHPERLSLQVAAMQAAPDIAVIGSALRVIDSTGNPTGEVREVITEDADIRWGLRFGNPIAQPTTMFRRSAVLAAGNYPDRNGDEDYAMWLRLSLTNRLTNLKDVLVDYRVHRTNITHTFQSNLQQHIRNRQAQLNEDLFPRLSEEQAIKIYDALCPHQQQTIELADLRRLAQAAACLAYATNLPLAKIQRTSLYRKQRHELWTRYLKQQVVIRQAWPALKLIKRAAVETKSFLTGDGGQRCPHA